MLALNGHRLKMSAGQAAELIQHAAAGTMDAAAIAVVIRAHLVPFPGGRS